MNNNTFNWDLLSRLAYDFEEYEEIGTFVGFRGQEELQGYIIEVDYEEDSTGLAYLVDWGNSREMWVSREEIYRIATEDSKELINPRTDKIYSESRVHEEWNWNRYSKKLISMAHYEAKKQTQADKLLWKSEQIDKVSKRIKEVIEIGKELVSQGMEGSNEHIQLKNEYNKLNNYIAKLMK